MNDWTKFSQFEGGPAGQHHGREGVSHTTPTSTTPNRLPQRSANNIHQCPHPSCWLIFPVSEMSNENSLSTPPMHISTNLPSRRWTFFDGWDYNGMKERLQSALDKIDKPALLHHAERIKGQKLVMSEPFSAGQYWICFEMIAEDNSLVIARVRLPRHPDVPATVREEEEAYGISCEVATMEFVRQRLPAIHVPCLYAYEGPGPRLAADAGAVYMLLEGFYGNTLQDVQFDICSLPVSLMPSPNSISS